MALREDAVGEIGEFCALPTIRSDKMFDKDWQEYRSWKPSRIDL